MKSTACSIEKVRERERNHCFSTNVFSWIFKRNTDGYTIQRRTLSNFLNI